MKQKTRSNSTDTAETIELGIDAHPRPPHRSDREGGQAGARAARYGDLKLVRYGDKSHWEIFPLKTNPAGMDDLAGKLPDKARELAKRQNRSVILFA